MLNKCGKHGRYWGKSFPKYIDISANLITHGDMSIKIIKVPPYKSYKIAKLRQRILRVFTTQIASLLPTDDQLITNTGYLTIA